MWTCEYCSLDLSYLNIIEVTIGFTGATTHAYTKIVPVHAGHGMLY